MVEIVGHNTSTRKWFPLKVVAIFIGFHSHCFNFAIKDVLERHKAVVDQVQTLMLKLSNQIPPAKLRLHTTLKTKLVNGTRWGCNYIMLRRFVAIMEFVPRLGLLDVDELNLE